MAYADIGKRVQRTREQAGLSQAELAARIGCTQSALSNYELGKRRIYLSTLEQIARALKRPLSYFIDSHPDSYSQNLTLLLEDHRLREILMEAVELPVEDKDRVLEYIKWRKSVMLAQVVDSVEIWEGFRFL
ncbi:MAG: helix-turn-helix domain-containing protein [Chloroflexota bacterium]|nr:helix-turn-helix domain-containing protein [Chloroflexota bacterium]